MKIGAKQREEVASQQGLQRRKKNPFALSGALFMAPFLLFFLFFTIVPVACAIALSFCDFNIVTAPTFTGLSNYVRMFLDDAELLKAMKNTLVFAFLTGPLSYFLCVILAWLVNEMAGKMRILFTAIFYIPSTVTSAIGIFQYIFSGDAYGLMNSALIKIGLISEPIAWLVDPNYNMTIIIVIQLWLSLGAGFLAFIAGFQSIDASMYESGAIDGIRNRYQEFYYLTLPSIRPQLMFGAVMQIASSFSVASVPMVLTGFPSTNDSTTTIISHMLDISTLRMEMGYACAIAVALFLVMILTRNVISLLIQGD